MRLFRFLSITALFALIAVGNIGGCSSNKNNLPPGACEMPRLDTDFLEETFDFVDEDNDLVIRVTSDGEFVAITIFFGDGEVFDLFAEVTGRNHSEIFEAVIEAVEFDASGDGVRRNSGRTFDINNLIIGEEEFIDFSGQCEVIAPL